MTITPGQGLSSWRRWRPCEWYTQSDKSGPQPRVSHTFFFPAATQRSQPHLDLCFNFPFSLTQTPTSTKFGHRAKQPRWNQSVSLRFHPVSSVLPRRHQSAFCILYSIRKIERRHSSAWLALVVRRRVFVRDSPSRSTGPSWAPFPSFLVASLSGRSTGHHHCMR